MTSSSPVYTSRTRTIVPEKADIIVLWNKIAMPAVATAKVSLMVILKIYIPSLDKVLNILYGPATNIKQIWN